MVVCTLAHALADYFRCKVVVAGTDDKELVVGPALSDWIAVAMEIPPK